MFGWLSAARVFASRSNRARRSGSSAKASGRILIATSRSSFVSRARYTSPMPPSPSFPRTSNGPIFAPIMRSSRTGLRRDLWSVTRSLLRRHERRQVLGKVENEDEAIPGHAGLIGQRHRRETLAVRMEIVGTVGDARAVHADRRPGLWRVGAEGVAVDGVGSGHDFRRTRVEGIDEEQLARGLRPPGIAAARGRDSPLAAGPGERTDIDFIVAAGFGRV